MNIIVRTILFQTCTQNYKCTCVTKYHKTLTLTVQRDKRHTNQNVLSSFCNRMKYQGTCIIISKIKKYRNGLRTIKDLKIKSYQTYKKILFTILLKHLNLIQVQEWTHSFVVCVLLCVPKYCKFRCKYINIHKFNFYKNCQLR